MRYILQLLVAEVHEVDRQLVADLLVDTARNTDAAGICERLKPFSDIDSVAKQVAPFDDHIAQIDSDAKQHSLGFWRHLIEQADRPLNLDAGSKCVDRA